MLNKNVLILLAGLFALIYSANSISESTNCKPMKNAFIIGDVVDKKNKEALYCEYHIAKKNINPKDIAFVSDFVDVKTVLSAPDITLVKYLQEDTLIAVKLLVYSAKRYQPEVFQKDLRFDEWRIAFKKEGVWQIGYKKPEDDKINLSEFKENDFIVDAGFDRYIQNNWDELLQKKRSVFSFLSVPHLRSVALRVNPTKCDFSKNDKQTCFNVDINNFVFRLFSGALKLTYSTDQKRLSTFEGVVNILGDNKKSPKAYIYYQYFDKAKAESL